MPKISVTTRQLPVGQGGMMISLVKNSVDASSAPFTFMFDCGSLNRLHLNTGFERLDEKRVDILFISHLDGDHVNGVDMLTHHLESIDTVVLPCLDSTTIAAYVLAEASKTEMTTEFCNLLSDPAKWFGERNVRRVIFLRRPTDDEMQARPGTGRRASIRLSNPNFRNGLAVTLQSRNLSTISAHAARTAELIEADADTVIDIASSKDTSTALWTLIPYNHPFDDKLVNAFHAAAGTVIKGMRKPGAAADPSVAPAILRAIENKPERDVLKACYRILDNDGNVPSLSLYSGPPAVAPKLEVRTPDFPTPQAGWLTTGDAKLKAAWIRKPWMERYDAVFDKVGLFVLPHHGSDYSIDQSVLTRLSHASMLACADSKSTKHPHKKVVEKMKALKIAHHIVSEKPGSEYQTIVNVEI
ncbi:MULTISPECIES: ComEC/Rec2 family competence protein [Burkholderia]|uniref:hypothetical protein n=1 Tax=Burkholderia TaxID=32008 RepID=UPI00158E48F1|nr:hypothetical protein [Burkholderia cepacia]MCA8053102.1 hypothetical protein [Burkholderia cepacia]MCA8134286.1 hypothetical protein [Burkholderia cepacia]MCA8159019.1 hypothetical protein [Burkholderia cepacia]HEM7890792.1 hypothetical protein [Burkholderia cepacia]HEM8511875.1 hypothetical protein [Burkholderia cepacia]